MEDSIDLTTQFIEHEVCGIVWDCARSKTPRPDEFNFTFIKAHLEMLKVDFTQAINYFHKFRKWPRECNYSFITLIPNLKILKI